MNTYQPPSKTNIQYQHLFTSLQDTSTRLQSNHQVVFPYSHNAVTPSKTHLNSLTMSRTRYSNASGETCFSYQNNGHFVYPNKTFVQSPQQQQIISTSVSPSYSNYSSSLPMQKTLVSSMQPTFVNVCQLCQGRYSSGCNTLCAGQNQQMHTPNIIPDRVYHQLVVERNKENLKHKTTMLISLIKTQTSVDNLSSLVEQKMIEKELEISQDQLNEYRQNNVSSLNKCEELTATCEEIDKQTDQLQEKYCNNCQAIEKNSTNGVHNHGQDELDVYNHRIDVYKHGQEREERTCQTEMDTYLNGMQIEELKETIRQQLRKERETSGLDELNQSLLIDLNTSLLKTEQAEIKNKQLQGQLQDSRQSHISQLSTKYLEIQSYTNHKEKQHLIIQNLQAELEQYDAIKTSLKDEIQRVTQERDDLHLRCLDNKSILIKKDIQINEDAKTLINYKRQVEDCTNTMDSLIRCNQTLEKRLADTTISQSLLSQEMLAQSLSELKAQKEIVQEKEEALNALNMEYKILKENYEKVDSNTDRKCTQMIERNISQYSLCKEMEQTIQNFQVEKQQLEQSAEDYLRTILSLKTQMEQLQGEYMQQEKQFQKKLKEKEEEQHILACDYDNKIELYKQTIESIQNGRDNNTTPPNSHLKLSDICTITNNNSNYVHSKLDDNHNLSALFGDNPLNHSRLSSQSSRSKEETRLMYNKLSQLSMSTAAMMSTKYDYVTLKGLAKIN